MTQIDVLQLIQTQPDAQLVAWMGISLVYGPMKTELLLQNGYQLTYSQGEISWQARAPPARLTDHALRLEITWRYQPHLRIALRSKSPLVRVFHGGQEYLYFFVDKMTAWVRRDITSGQNAYASWHDHPAEICQLTEDPADRWQESPVLWGNSAYSGSESFI